MLMHTEFVLDRATRPAHLASLSLPRAKPAPMFGDICLFHSASLLIPTRPQPVCPHTRHFAQFVRYLRKDNKDFQRQFSGHTLIVEAVF